MRFDHLPKAPSYKNRNIFGEKTIKNNNICKLAPAIIEKRILYNNFVTKHYKITNEVSNPMFWWSRNMIQTLLE